MAANATLVLGRFGAAHAHKRKSHDDDDPDDAGGASSPCKRDGGGGGGNDDDGDFVLLGPGPIANPFDEYDGPDQRLQQLQRMSHAQHLHDRSMQQRYSDALRQHDRRAAPPPDQPPQ